MRSWNSVQQAFQGLGLGSSQFTNEELKYFLQSESSFNRHSSQFTNEELKYVVEVVMTPTESIQGSQFTNEELKLDMEIIFI